MEKLGSGKLQLLTILTIFSFVLTACSSDEKRPISITINEAPVPEPKPRLVEKCRLQAPEGGYSYTDPDGTTWNRPSVRVCEMVPAG
jgi:hypothetical protein